jgi:hypothetical protein
MRVMLRWRDAHDVVNHNHRSHHFQLHAFSHARDEDGIWKGKENDESMKI